MFIVANENNETQTALSTDITLHMSSREIATLTDKRHDHVCRDIRAILSALLEGEADTYIRNPNLGYLTNYDVECVQYDKDNPNGWEYLLSRRYTEILITGYDIKRRTAVIDRWFELESQKKTTTIDPVAVLNDPIVMRGLLLNYTEKVLALEGKVSDMQPDVDALERIANSEGSLCLMDAAKTRQIQPKELTHYLHENQWIFKRPGSDRWTAYQLKIIQGLLVHKAVTIMCRHGRAETIDQVRITPKGITTLAKKFSG